MNYYAFIGLFNGIVVLATVIGILLKRNRFDFYKSFIVFSLCVGGWSIFYAMWQIQTTHDSALFWMRLAMLMVYPSCFGFLWFVMQICGFEKKLWQRNLIIGVAAFFVLMSFNKLMIEGMGPKLIFEFWPVPGPLMYLYTFVFGFCVALSFVLLGISYFRAVGTHQWQIKWIIFTMAPAWLGGSTNWLLWYGIDFAPLPNFFVGVGWLLLAYAMMRIKLFDIDVLAEYVHEARLSAIGLLTASIHHEIKSPVFVMKGLAETGLDKLKTSTFKNQEDAEKQLADVCEKIIHQSSRVLEIISSFREMARSKKGKTFLLEAVHLKKVINDIFPLFANELRSKEIDFQCEIPEDVVVRADRSSMEEIFLNLLLNSIQAIENKGCISISVSLDEKKVIVCIKDDGKGIPWEARERLFEPFFSDKREGSGLGLYIVKELISRNQGSIYIFNSENRGGVAKLSLVKANYGDNQVS